jgi:chromosome segregation ATPase
VQIESYKLDFEAERKDRVAAHSKLADLEREMAKKKSHIDVERATYEKRFGEYQKGAASYTEQKKQLTKQKGELEREVDKLRSDSAKQKVEVDKLRDEVKAKVSQVRQYKKENDRLKAQVHTVCV